MNSDTKTIETLRETLHKPIVFELQWVDKIPIDHAADDLWGKLQRQAALTIKL